MHKVILMCLIYTFSKSMVSFVFVLVSVSMSVTWCFWSRTNNLIWEDSSSVFCSPVLLKIFTIHDKEDLVSCFYFRQDGRKLYQCLQHFSYFSIMGVWFFVIIRLSLGNVFRLLIKHLESNSQQLRQEHLQLSLEFQVELIQTQQVSQQAKIKKLNT